MNKQDIIKEKAMKLGAKPEDWRRWKFRGRIPPKWRELIFTWSAGSVTFGDMDNLFKAEK